MEKQKKDFNAINKLVRRILSGEKSILVRSEYRSKFVAICEIYDIPIFGGAYIDGPWGDGQYFYTD